MTMAGVMAFGGFQVPAMAATGGNDGVVRFQKVLEMHNCDCKDILEVNKSVQDTVDKLTSLEIVLKTKLDLITPILDGCQKKPPKAKPED